MPSNNEMYSGELCDDSYETVDTGQMSELESNLAEAESAAITERRETATPPPDNISDEETVSEEFEVTSSRARQERLLRRYQEQELTRIPDLISKVISTELVPKYRQGYKISGEIGKKGRRGL